MFGKSCCGKFRYYYPYIFRFDCQIDLKLIINGTITCSGLERDEEEEKNSYNNISANITIDDNLFINLVGEDDDDDNLQLLSITEPGYVFNKSNISSHGVNITMDDGKVVFTKNEILVRSNSRLKFNYKLKEPSTNSFIDTELLLFSDGNNSYIARKSQHGSIIKIENIDSPF